MNPSELVGKMLESGPGIDAAAKEFLGYVRSERRRGNRVPVDANSVAEYFSSGASSTLDDLAMDDDRIVLSQNGTVTDQRMLDKVTREYGAQIAVKAKALNLGQRVIGEDEGDMSPAEVKQDVIGALNAMRRLLHSSSTMSSLARLTQLDGYPGKAYAALGRDGDVANEIIKTALEWAQSIPEREFREGGAADELYSVVNHYASYVDRQPDGHPDSSR